MSKSRKSPAQDRSVGKQPRPVSTTARELLASVRSGRPPSSALPRQNSSARDKLSAEMQGLFWALGRLRSWRTRAAEAARRRSPKPPFTDTEDGQYDKAFDTHIAGELPNLAAYEVGKQIVSSMSPQDLSPSAAERWFPLRAAIQKEKIGGYLDALYAAADFPALQYELSHSLAQVVPLLAQLRGESRAIMDTLNLMNAAHYSIDNSAIWERFDQACEAIRRTWIQITDIPVTTGSFTPTDADMQLLTALAARPTRCKAESLDARGVGQRTKSDRLVVLEAAGLVDRQAGKKSGWAITDAGRRLIPTSVSYLRR